MSPFCPNIDWEQRYRQISSICVNSRSDIHAKRTRVSLDRYSRRANYQFRVALMNLLWFSPPDPSFRLRVFSALSLSVDFGFYVKDVPAEKDTAIVVQIKRTYSLRATTTFSVEYITKLEVVNTLISVKKEHAANCRLWNYFALSSLHATDSTEKKKYIYITWLSI